MATQKQRVVIIEDNYRQYQIIRDLLRHDYEILPSIANEKQFRSLKAKLMRFLDKEDVDFQIALENYENVNAFVVDFELKQESNKTGILFCRLTECIYNGSKSVLFLTIQSKAIVANEIKRVKNDIPKIVCDDLRKPELWDEESKTVEAIVGDSQSGILKSDIIRIINELIEKSKQNKNFVHDIGNNELSEMEKKIKNIRENWLWSNSDVKEQTKTDFLDLLDKILNQIEIYKDNDNLLTTINNCTDPTEDNLKSYIKTIKSYIKEE
jgi:hypothetical protein